MADSDPKLAPHNVESAGFGSGDVRSASTANAAWYRDTTGAQEQNTQGEVDY